MWKVKFNEIEVFTSKTDIEALQFALSLHQASNVTHSVEVFDPEGYCDAVLFSADYDLSHRPEFVSKTE